TDDTLLARLNALKGTPISPSRTPHASITPTRPTRPTTQDDDLLARFARLGSASPIASASSPRALKKGEGEGGGGGGGSAPVIAPGAESYLEAVAEGIGSAGDETQVNEEDERSLEELVRELDVAGGLGGEARGWDVSREEERDLGRLVREVRGALPGEDGVDWENVEFDVGSGGVRVGKDSPPNNDPKKEDERTNPYKTEEEEAEELVSRVLNETPEPPTPPANNDPQSDNNENNNSNDEGDSDDDPLTLPSVPSDPSPLPPSSLPQTLATEEDLTRRFASLFSSPAPSTNNSDDLTLPSVPTAFKSKSQSHTLSNLPTFTDEEIASWCCICNDDATLKCLGCDGDLYCRDCWMEGHRGEGAGWEERTHKAVVYARDK
ncbi:uncharacterized protein EI97DRAFT_354120, partial [Westerdykella ornata]